MCPCPHTLTDPKRDQYLSSRALGQALSTTASSFHFIFTYCLLVDLSFTLQILFKKYILKCRKVTQGSEAKRKTRSLRLLIAPVTGDNHAAFWSVNPKRLPFWGYLWIILGLERETGLPVITLPLGAQIGPHLTQSVIVLSMPLPNQLVAPITAMTGTDGALHQHLSGCSAFRLTDVARPV